MVSYNDFFNLKKKVKLTTFFCFSFGTLKKNSSKKTGPLKSKIDQNGYLFFKTTYAASLAVLAGVAIVSGSVARAVVASELYFAALASRSHDAAALVAAAV